MSPRPLHADVRLAHPDELPACLAVRHEVFCVGQQVPLDLEVDGLDPRCTHLVAAVEGAVVGTARLLPTDGAHAKAQRVAVLASHRGQGLGLRLMQALERAAADAGYGEVLLHAQADVIGFYEAQGYVGEGERFDEAGIEHLAMRKRLETTG